MGHIINRLSDGRVEVMFGEPFPEDSNISKSLVIALGWRKGNEILVQGGEVAGVRCHPADWEDLLKCYAPERISEFKKAIEEKKD